MAEVKRCGSPSKDAIEIVVEASCSGEAGSTSPRSVPPTITAESPSFLTWMWIQILTACSGVWGGRGGGLSGPRTLGLASVAHQTQENSESEVLRRIAASKSTWSEVPGRDIHHSVSSPYPSQLSVWEELEESAPASFEDWGDYHSVSSACPSQLSDWEELKESSPDFFRDWGDHLELGPLIAEGGQAQIFEVRAPWFLGDRVVKVFKLEAGFSLADFKRHWPRSMRRKDGEDCSEFKSMQERRFGFVFEDLESNVYGSRCFIEGATLLKDGRFAFLMERYWGDLRRLIDLKVKQNTHPWRFNLLCKNRREQLPFSFKDSIWIMLQIARGMQGLHREGVLHRDVKAANVLIGALGFNVLQCVVADYECAMFVKGTGFWRAPEVLQELQKKEEDRNEDIWTEKVDVYSFGMTCYEILTSQIPFDGYTQSKWDDVIKGERPFLPKYVFPELRELVDACWHAQPSQRPSFEVIVRELDSIWHEGMTWK